MTKLKPAEDAPADFAWPEPLVIDIIAERYQDIADRHERLTLARLQAQALGEIYAGRDRPAAAARVELIAFCAARRIAPDRVARVDLAVFWELAHVATTRFRTSPRIRDTICRRLEAALERVRPTPPRQDQSKDQGDQRPRPAARASAGVLRQAVSG